MVPDTCTNLLLGISPSQFGQGIPDDALPELDEAVDLDELLEPSDLSTPLDALPPKDPPLCDAPEPSSPEPSCPEPLPLRLVLSLEPRLPCDPSLALEPEPFVVEPLRPTPELLLPIVEPVEESELLPEGDTLDDAVDECAPLSDASLGDDPEENELDEGRLLPNEFDEENSLTDENDLLEPRLLLIRIRTTNEPLVALELIVSTVREAMFSKTTANAGQSQCYANWPPLSPGNSQSHEFRGVVAALLHERSNHDR